MQTKPQPTQYQSFSAWRRQEIKDVGMAEGFEPPRQGVDPAQGDKSAFQTYYRPGMMLTEPERKSIWRRFERAKELQKQGKLKTCIRYTATDHWVCPYCLKQPEEDQVCCEQQGFIYLTRLSWSGGSMNFPIVLPLT